MSDFNDQRRKRAEARYWPTFHKALGTGRDEPDIPGDLVKFDFGTNFKIAPEEFNYISRQVRIRSNFPATNLSLDRENSCIVVECHEGEEHKISDWICDNIARITQSQGSQQSDDWTENAIAGVDICYDHPEGERSTMGPIIFEDDWFQPEDLTLSSLMIDHVFSEENILELQQITGCTITRIPNGIGFHLKAGSKDSLKDVKDRLGVLAKHYLSALAEQNDEHFLYAEATTHWACEFIHWAKYDRDTMKTIFLDPSVYTIEEGKSAYRRVFSRGTTIRCVPYDSDRKSFIRISGWNFASCTTQAVGSASTAAVFNWKYKEKTPKPYVIIDKSEIPEAGPVTSSSSGFQTSDNATTDWVANLPQFPKEEQVKEEANTTYDVMRPFAAPSSSHPTIRECRTIDDVDTTTEALFHRDPASTLVNMGRINDDKPPNARTQKTTEQVNRDERLNHAAATEHDAEEEDPDKKTTTPWVGPRSTYDRNRDPFASIWSSAYHNTMKQKKPSQHGKQPIKQTGLTPDPKPQLQAKVNEKLVQVLLPLRFMPGRVRLVAKFGRFIFTKLEIGGNGYSEQISPTDTKKILDQAHIGRKLPMFTSIITTHGGDADQFGQMKSNSGSLMWNHKGGKLVYEFICRERGNKGDTERPGFVIEVDGTTFNHKVFLERPYSTSLLIHCTKRLWDIKIEVSAAKDLKSVYGNFAKKLVDSLRVSPLKNGIPILEFSVPVSSGSEYHPQVRWVRIRNTAVYDWADSGKLAPVGKNDANKTKLGVAEVHDLQLHTSLANGSIMSYETSRPLGNSRLGQPGKWYEASIQSEVISSALAENQRFQLGGEAKWSPQTFEKCAAFEELLKAATETVKNMDGLGRHGDNEQDTMIHPLPAWMTSGIKLETQNTRARDWG